MAMSFVQDRSGFPYMAPPLFEYLCGMSTTNVTKEDVSSYEVQQLFQQVCIGLVNFRQLFSCHELTNSLGINFMLLLRQAYMHCMSHFQYLSSIKRERLSEMA